MSKQNFIKPICSIKTLDQPTDTCTLKPYEGKGIQHVNQINSVIEEIKMETQIKITKGPNGVRIFLGSAFPGVYFTKREAEMAQLLSERKYQEIADILKISRRTAEYYAANMKKKLRCHNKTELVLVLDESGLAAQLSELVGVS